MPKGGKKGQGGKPGATTPQLEMLPASAVHPAPDSESEAESLTHRRHRAGQV